MKRIGSLIMAFSLFCNFSVKLTACTSFAVYSAETWYGMNFDYADVDIRFWIDKSHDKKVLLAQFGNGGFIAGINEDGLFANMQLLYYNDETPVFPNTSNSVSLGNLKDYALNSCSTIDEIKGYIGTKIITPSWGLNLHSMFADKHGNAFVAEPFGSENGIVDVKDNMLVMTNFPNYDFAGLSYTSVSGVGSDRYISACTYIVNHKQNFVIEDGPETLKNTIQTQGDYPTQVSLLFDPENLEVYFCFDHNFEAIWKISFENETIETYSGFSEHKVQPIGTSGIWSYELASWPVSIEENHWSKSEINIVNIYPNPSYGLFNFTFNNIPEKGSTTEVLNSSGNRVILKSIDKQNEILDLSDSPKGIYFVKVYINHNVFTSKLVVE